MYDVIYGSPPLQIMYVEDHRREWQAEPGYMVNKWGHA